MFFSVRVLKKGARRDAVSNLKEVLRSRSAWLSPEGPIKI